MERLGRSYRWWLGNTLQFSWRVKLLAWFATTRGAYQRLARARDQYVVLHDLARFCHYRGTLYVEDNRRSMELLEGRRQVFLRVVGYVRGDEQQLLDWYDRAQREEKEEDHE